MKPGSCGLSAQGLCTAQNGARRKLAAAVNHHHPCLRPGALLTLIIRTPLPTSHWYISDDWLPLNMQKGFMRAASIADVTAPFTI